MGPLVYGRTNRSLHSSRVGEKLVPRISVSGDQLFRHPVRPFQAPFVVVSIVISVGQPSFHNVVEVGIAVYFLGVQMAMIVNNRHACGMLMEQRPRRICCQQVVVIHECHSVSFDYTWQHDDRAGAVMPRTLC